MCFLGDGYFCAVAMKVKFKSRPDILRECSVSYHIDVYIVVQREVYIAIIIWKTLNNVLNGTETNHIYNLLRQSCSCFPFPIKCERLTPFCFRRIFFNDVYERWLQLRLDCYGMTSHTALSVGTAILDTALGSQIFTNLHKSFQKLSLVSLITWEGTTAPI